MLLVACGDNSTSFTLNGKIDVENGKMVYRVEADQNNQPSIIDSTQIQSGMFSFKGDVLRPEINFLQIEGVAGNFPIIIENGTITSNLFKDSLAVSNATGTISNDGFMRYKDQTKSFINTLNDIGSEMQKAVILKDTLLMVDLREQYQMIQDQIQEYEIDYVKTNNDSYISVLILERYLTKDAMSIETIKEIYSGFSDRLKNSRSAKVIEEKLNSSGQPGIEIGQVAPMFEGPNPEGDIIRLGDHLGKITIVEFWASWCRPCRVENPNFVRMYKKMQPKGLKIVAVSLDKEKAKWVKAIEDDGLTWEHVSNLKFWRDPIAELYNVTGIPANFVLDEKGTIVARNLRGFQLTKKIEELLN